MTEQIAMPMEGEAARQADDARREEYRERLRKYLHDPEFRRIEGFPIGKDEDILALSDPPYYTACPNPFLPEILREWQGERQKSRHELGLPDDSRDNGDVALPSPAGGRGAGGEGLYHREPFATDVSEGKNHPIYNAHSYHTKVPHKAIMRYILHYTEPGDIILDGFCGTGMTGVAAQLCGDRKAVQELGYIVGDDGVIYQGNAPISRLGARKAVLVELSPAATFIAYNYNTPVDVVAFEREASRVLREVERECGWMYETWHPRCDAPDPVKGRINYTVWSDVFVCPQCGQEMVFWDVAVDKAAGQVRDSFPCPDCGAQQTKRSLQRAWETAYDRALGRTVRRARQVPVLINYAVGRQRYEKQPDAEDLALIQKIEASDIPYWFPTDRMPEGDESRRNDDIGITHVHHFYTRRNLWVLSALWGRFLHSRPLQLLFNSQLTNISKMNRYRPNVSFPYNPLSGTLYIASQVSEANLFAAYFNKVRRMVAALTQERGGVALCACSASHLHALESSIDYIFVDPPFGGNLMYSELNFLWEAWLRVFTNNKPEAIVNNVQGKGLPEYQRLMQACFGEFYRVLKPGRWMTVEFHNSQNRVWNAIQEALLRAGFVVADVRTLDKQQDTFKQVTSSSAVKQDLIISAYKPRASFERRFLQEAGTAEGAWDFVRQHLEQLPVVVKLPSPASGRGAGGEGALETIAERQAYLLFDRMVAFHIQRGATVPLSAGEFYAGLRERYVARDAMFFLPQQVAEYDQARLSATEVAQLSLFLTDEKSAIQWLRQQLDAALGGAPQTYQEIQPRFLRELHQAPYEALPELGELLAQSFLQDDEGHWYAPDPSKAGDLEKLRERTLLREFDTYAKERGRLRQFRTEAVRAGFARCWKERNYQTIVKVAERLPESALQEDPDLLMYYDNATLRV